MRGCDLGFLGLGVAGERVVVRRAVSLIFAGRLGAGYVSPETAAAVRLLRERGELERAERVVVFDTGVGNKYPPPAELPPPPSVDAAVEFDRLLDLVQVA